MISLIVGIACFCFGCFVGSKHTKHKIIQVGGDNSYQIGIINNTKKDDDCANLPVW